MSVLCRSATTAELPALCAMLDREFIAGRGRAISLAQRFPSSLGAGNVDNIFVAFEGGRIAAALLSRPFSWQVAGKSYRGAMVGAVCTDPAHRGKGLATTLLDHAARRFQEQGVEFAVLWSTQHGFYERSGWICLDHGRFGDSGEREPAGAMPQEVDVRPLLHVDVHALDAISADSALGRVLRADKDWRQLPLPAERVDALLWNQDGKVAAYALVGRAGNAAIVYDMMGEQAGFPAIWSALAASCGRIMINDHPQRDSYRWLNAHTGIHWESKHLAMWLPLSADLKAAPQIFADWYISYFDHI